MARGAEIRDVVFDLGEVLIDWDPRHLYCAHLGEDAAVVEAFLSKICTRQWHARIDRGMSFARATAQLAARFPAHEEWIRLYAEGWEHMFAGERTESVACLRELAANGYRLHALSNYPGEKIQFLYRRFPFMASFETVILSGLVGAMKPEPAIFRCLLQRLDGRPSLFIDDRAENVAGARRLGIEAVHYNTAHGIRALEEALSR